MAVIYCTADQVAAFLQLPVVFSGSTNPTKVQVEEWIEDDEAIIEQETGHAWKELTATELLHMGEIQYDRRDGVAIFLRNRKVKTMSAGSGDVLTVWDGGTDLDYLANKVEGRINDFWFDYEKGILHMRTLWRRRPRFFSINITYRYGDAAVTRSIKRACILLTAIDIAGSNDRSIILPEGTSSLKIPQKVAMWQEQADKLIQRNREMKALVALS